MRRLVVSGAAIALMMLCVAAVVKRSARSAAPPNPGPAIAPAAGLVVHEWGTFTGFAGSDGVHLPFSTIVGSDLPEFVSNRQKEAARVDPRVRQATLFIKAGGLPALQRMETPVIYFYADAPREVDVRVDFPQGLLTEFYPPVRKLGPKYGKAFGEFEMDPPSKGGAAPASAADRSPASFLDWGRVRIVPHPAGDEGKRVPAITTKTHYAFARDTDAALVQFDDAAAGRHEEKFLFYRGLGNFTLPVKLTATGKDRFDLRNSSASAISSAYLVEIDAANHQNVRFARADNVAGNQTLTLPAAKSTQADLEIAIKDMLISNGLFEKEARAMVDTWKETWFDEPGTRLLYVLPRPITDALLPLHVAPAPDQTVRVLVGRIDILTPEQESHLRSMMYAAPATGSLAMEDFQALHDLGRFFEPALQRVRDLAGDPNQKQTNALREAYYRTAAHPESKASK